MPHVFGQRDLLPLPHERVPGVFAQGWLASAIDDGYREWAFGLCVLHLLNGSGLRWNHERF